MKVLSDKIVYFLSIGIIILYSSSISAQNTYQFQYINPLPNSSYVSVNSNIIIRKGNNINKAGINDNLIEAVGTKSGVHTGKIILANDSRTLIFTPYTPFKTDEEVTIILKDGLITADGLDAGELIFKFHTCINANTPVQENSPVKYKTASNTPKPSSLSTPDSLLPPDLPPLIIDKSNNPSPGYFFLSSTPYLEIVDNEGTPVFYQNVNGEIYDFDLQPDGELTYFLYPVSCYGLDGSGNLIRTFTTVNGFTVDVHDLRVLPNEDYYIFGKRNVYMDLSKIVSGGNDSADVIDGALQEFDSQGNLLFQWDALDHYKITDVNFNEVDLTQPQIDFSHFNSVEIDSDGNLLISARNMDEVTKVDRDSGNIIWRLGGKNNQFSFINDSLGFSQQHDIRRFSNGDISLFDNGVFHPVQISSAVEYKLDEVNKTATLIYRIYHDNIFTVTEGSVQEMTNGNRVIGWGQNWDPEVTEVTLPNDSIAFDLSYQKSPVDVYRAFKYQWKTNLFTTNTDSIDFGKVTVGSSLLKQFTVYNPHTTAVTINEFYCSNPSFSTNIPIPVTILPNDSLVVPVTFKPAQDSSFTVSFNVRNIGLNNGALQMIARQVILSGTTKNISSINNIVQPKQYQLYQNYPNPFNPTTVISFALPFSSNIKIEVYNILGERIKELLNEQKNAGYYEINFNTTGLASGVYLYTIEAKSTDGKSEYRNTKKMVLLK